jgi:hypothetical protein
MWTTLEPYRCCVACEMPRSCSGVRSCAKNVAGRTPPEPPADWALTRAAERIADHNVRLRSFLLRLLDPDDLGHAVTPEVRQLAREQVSNLQPHINSCPPCNGNCRQGRDCPASRG